MADPHPQPDDARSSHSVTEALLRWKAGDDNAQFDLQPRLQGLVLDLIRYVRRNRDHGLAAVIESEGIVNKALCSFLIGARMDAFPDLRGRENVRKLLFDMVEKALRQEIRHKKRQCRNSGREIHDETVLEHLPAVPTDDAFAPTCDEGAAELRLAAREFLESLQKTVRPVHEKAMDILERLLEGWSSGEIARNLDMGQRNVQKIIKSMRDAWYGGDSIEGGTDVPRAPG